MSTDPYIIPGTKVLRNKLGITDPVALDRAERLLVVQRTIEGPPTGKYDLDHLKAIHRHLFQDLYDWAGEIRTVEIAKQGHAFQFIRFIPAGIADVHRRIERAKFFKGLSEEDFSRQAAEIIGDVNFVHPFRERNGRTQLEYLRLLAIGAEHDFDPDRLDPDTWQTASRHSHSGEYGAMAAAILEQGIRGSPERAKEKTRQQQAAWEQWQRGQGL